MSDWQKLQVQIPGKDYLAKVRNVLETLMVYLEVLKAILETVKAFLIDFGNPIAALVKSLISLILELFEALKQTGLYMYVDIPVPDTDPNFVANAGGSPAFMLRFKASLYDSRDPCRPQPVPLFNQAGFIILMVDAGSVVRLIRLIRMLLRFFGQDYLTPRFAAPASAQVLPLGSNKDPILSIAKVFSTNIKAVALEWSLPTSQYTPEPSFRSVVADTVSEFVPPSFLIEKTEVNPYQEITVDDAKSAKSSGIISYTRETGFERSGKRVSRKDRLFDIFGDPVIKFQKYYIVGPTDTPLTFWTGQLGTFRWIDTEVEKDKTYYYRVRAFSGSLKLNESTHELDFSNTLKSTPTQAGVFEWPSGDGEEPLMGKPSAIMRIRLPKYYGNFDVLENLFRLFLVAFSLDFHRPATVVLQPPVAAAGQTQKIVRPVFDAKGLPVAPTITTDIGLGSLVNYAGVIANFSSIPLVGLVANATTLKSFQPDPILGRHPEMPWQQFLIRCEARRVANLVAQAMLQAGSAAIDGFRAIMTGPLPYGPIATDGGMLSKATLQECLFALTQVTPDEDPLLLRINYDQAVAYGWAYFQASFRLNVLAAVESIKHYTLNGTPPDWQSIALFHIFPWSAKILYRILATIQALLDAFNGVMSEIRAFIDLLLRKIDALERFIAFLIKIMEYIVSLDVSCYCLNVSGITQGLPQLMSVLDEAAKGAGAPPNDPGGYSAGIALAYVAPDIKNIRKAFDMIF